MCVWLCVCVLVCVAVTRDVTGCLWIIQTRRRAQKPAPGEPKKPRGGGSSAVIRRGVGVDGGGTGYATYANGVSAAARRRTGAEAVAPTAAHPMVLTRGGAVIDWVTVDSGEHSTPFREEALTVEDARQVDDDIHACLQRRPTDSPSLEEIGRMRQMRVAQMLASANPAMGGVGDGIAAAASRVSPSRRRAGSASSRTAGVGGGGVPTSAMVPVAAGTPAATLAVARAATRRREAAKRRRVRTTSTSQKSPTGKGKGKGAGSVRAKERKQSKKKKKKGKKKSKHKKHKKHKTKKHRRGSGSRRRGDAGDSDSFPSDDNASHRPKKRRRMADRGSGGGVVAEAWRSGRKARLVTRRNAPRTRRRVESAGGVLPPLREREAAVARSDLFDEVRCVPVATGLTCSDVTSRVVDLRAPCQTAVITLLLNDPSCASLRRDVSQAPTLPSSFLRQLRSNRRLLDPSCRAQVVANVTSFAVYTGLPLFPFVAPHPGVVLFIGPPVVDLSPEYVALCAAVAAVCLCGCCEAVWYACVAMFVWVWVCGAVAVDACVGMGYGLTSLVVGTPPGI